MQSLAQSVFLSSLLKCGRKGPLTTDSWKRREDNRERNSVESDRPTSIVFGEAEITQNFLLTQRSCLLTEPTVWELC